MDLARLGKLGVWTSLDSMAAPQAAEFARRIEALGYSVLWHPEALGRDPVALMGFLAPQTSRLVFATGIANIYARDPMTANAARLTLGELSGGRFILGLGVSHALVVAGVRKHEYGRPVSTMRAYLEAMKDKPYMAPAPPSEPPVLLVPPEHTARAREILGRGPWLAPEQMVLREADPAKARALARATMKLYLGLPNYLNSLRWLGYRDDDFADGGSDRLVDAIVCWGDEKAIAARVQAHLDAGADHVCIQPIRADGQPGPDLRLLEALAPDGHAAPPSR